MNRGARGVLLSESAILRRAGSLSPLPNRQHGEMKHLQAFERKMLASPDQQISLTDPDSRSGRNSTMTAVRNSVHAADPIPLLRLAKLLASSTLLRPLSLAR